MNKLKETTLLNCLLFFCLSFISVHAQEKKPNILFIFADDHSYEALSQLGSAVQTPNIDKLIKSGTHFTHAYNQGSWTGAVCVASRTQIITGRSLWSAKQADEKLSSGNYDKKLWPQLLKDQGYETYMSGKWHVKIQPEKIFDHVAHERPGMPNQTDQGYNRPVEGQPDIWSPWDTSFGGFWRGGKHWSEVLAEDGIVFLQQASENNKPFFMYLAFNAPHDPRQSPKEYVDMYPIDNIQVPKDFLPEYPYNEAMDSGRGVRDEKLAPFPRTEHAVKVNRQEYYAIITHMDAQIGKILKELERTGRKDNTYIIFTADHGLAVGHHGLMGKQNMFDHSVRVPFVIVGPDIPKNKKVDTRIYLQDVVPTTLELAGGKAPEYMDFKSLVPLLRESSSDHYEAIYGAYKEKQRMVTLGDYKLIHYPAIHKSLLFNLKKDPHEMHNLADKAKYKNKVEELLATWQSMHKKLHHQIP